MKHPAGKHGRGAWAWALASLACSPGSDLDLHAAGGEPAGGQAEMAGSGGGSTLSTVSTLGGAASGAQLPGPLASGGSSGRAEDGLASSVPLDMEVAAGARADAGATEGAPDPEPVLASDAGAVGGPEPEPPLPVPAPELPDDLIGAPVVGEIDFSDEAEWEVEGVFEPTFEIHTPTASYWVVKPLGTIVSIMDRENEPAQWIDFSSGFRPLRGVPRFPDAPARVTTVRDDESQTPTHLRLTSESDDGLWQWIWDFYVSHVTLTVNRAPAPFGFAYQGVPGGSLGTEDRLVLSTGVAQGARSSFNGDLPGPAEWAYLADTELARSIFAIQHRGDSLPERYQVRDNDTSLLSLGNGQIQTLPARFSLGLIPTLDHEAVTQRVEFVVGAIR